MGCRSKRYLSWPDTRLSHSHALRDSSPSIRKMKVSSNLLPRPGTVLTLLSVATSDTLSGLPLSRLLVLLSAIDGEVQGRRGGCLSFIHITAQQTRGRANSPCSHPWGWLTCIPHVQDKLCSAAQVRNSACSPDCSSAYACEGH